MLNSLDVTVDGYLQMLMGRCGETCAPVDFAQVLLISGQRGTMQMPAMFCITILEHTIQTCVSLAEDFGGITPEQAEEIRLQHQELKTELGLSM